MRFLVSLMLVCSLFTPVAAQVKRSDAQPEFPVAVRWWGQAMVSIETGWGLTVVIDPYDERIGYDTPDITGDLVLVTHDHSDHNNVGLVKGNPIIARGPTNTGGASGGDSGIYHALFRLPNESKVQWLFNGKAAQSQLRNLSAVTVDSIPAWHDASEGKERGATAMFVVEAGGVRIAHCGDLGQLELTEYQLQSLTNIDVLLVPVGGVYTIDGAQAWRIVQQIQPRIVVPIHYKTDKLKAPLEPLDKFLSHRPSEWKLDKPSHNTLAVRRASKVDKPEHKVVALDYHPWRATGELKKLMDKMRNSCRASQKVFRPLSANQMNFKPANGTHTPRWNTEHMMGRQLGFFSQIYSKLDPELKHINLNPKQMPPDYIAAHPDWTGAEEARQMQRVSDYVDRYAYLLDGMDLDKKAPGSFWTLRRLLRQMDRHYAEHTANVQKKFELEGWPKG